MPTTSPILLCDEPRELPMFLETRLPIGRAQGTERRIPLCGPQTGGREDVGQTILRVVAATPDAFVNRNRSPALPEVRHCAACPPMRSAAKSARSVRRGCLLQTVQDHTL